MQKNRSHLFSPLLFAPLSCYLFIFSLFVVAAPLVGCHADMAQRGLNPGDAPPNFTLNTLEGTPLSLESLKGKVVVLNFWATWCGPCVEELPAFQQLFKRYGEKGLVVIGIGVDDDLPSLKEFQKRFALTYPLIFDRDGDIKRRYRLTGVPESFVLDRQGRLAMLVDPDTGMPSVRVTGARVWDAAAMTDQLEKLLGAS